MNDYITAKEASKLSGRSVTWLRTHECAWCGQTALNSLRYGCSAFYETCEHRKRNFNTAKKGLTL